MTACYVDVVGDIAWLGRVSCSACWVECLIVLVGSSFL